jgi:hypothetical protein
MADWTTISALSTAGGTLVLAAATFASVRSANRSARAAERSLLAGLRPLLIPSHPQDPQQKVNFVDGTYIVVPGGGGVAKAEEGAVYLALSLRNAGSGIAVLHGWHFYPEQTTTAEHFPVDEFTRLTRDLYVPAGDTGFWQGSFRDPSSEEFAAAKRAIDAHAAMSVDVLYSDLEGGQRLITRFAMLPAQDGAWLAAAGRHWTVDGVDPRS